MGAIEAIFLFLLFIAIHKNDYAGNYNQKSDPNHNTDKNSINLLQGRHRPTFVVERHQACDEDDHIEDKRHVHVHVDHHADHFAPAIAEAPVISGVVVNPEGYRQKENEVSENEVEYSNGGDRCGAGLHDMNHQAQADDTTEQNHRIDSKEDFVILISLL